MDHLLNAQKVSRARVVAGANPQQPHISPLNETHRGPEILLNVAQDELRIEFIIRILRRNAIRPISVGSAFVLALDGIRIKGEIPSAAQKARGGQTYISAERGARYRKSRMTVRKNSTNMGLVPECSV